MFDCKGARKRAINITNNGKEEICINLNRVSYIDNKDGKIEICFDTHSIEIGIKEKEERESVFGMLCKAMIDD